MIALALSALVLVYLNRALMLIVELQASPDDPDSVRTERKRAIDLYGGSSKARTGEPLLREDAAEAVSDP